MRLHHCRTRTFQSYLPGGANVAPSSAPHPASALYQCYTQSLWVYQLLDMCRHNCPFTCGYLDSNLIHGSFGQSSPQSACQMASWLVLPFLHSWWQNLGDAAMCGLVTLSSGFWLVSDIAIFVLKRDVKLQLSNWWLLASGNKIRIFVDLCRLIFIASRS